MTEVAPVFEQIPFGPCVTCGHSPDWHRFDDYQMIKTGVTSALDPGAKFRCCGPGLEGCGDECPDYVRPQ